MANQPNRIFLFVHVIWTVKDNLPLLRKPVRTVLLAHLQQHAPEQGILVKAVNGTEDHLHILLQLMPAQNLSQVIRQLKDDAAHWVNNSKLITETVEWEEGFAAYSVSPSGVKQVTDYIQRQEEHHKNKTLAQELEVFDKMQF